MPALQLAVAVYSKMWIVLGGHQNTIFRTNKSTVGKRTNLALTNPKSSAFDKAPFNIPVNPMINAKTLVRGLTKEEIFHPEPRFYVRPTPPTEISILQSLAFKKPVLSKSKITYSIYFDMY